MKGPTKTDFARMLARMSFRQHDYIASIYLPTCRICGVMSMREGSVYVRPAEAALIRIREVQGRRWVDDYDVFAECVEEQAKKFNSGRIKEKLRRLERHYVRAHNKSELSSKYFELSLQ